MNKHLTDHELQADAVAADMYQAGVLLNDGERTAALWQTIPDTLHRFMTTPHAPETLSPAETLREVDTACEPLARSVRVLDAYRVATGAHFTALHSAPMAPARVESAQHATAQLAAALRETAGVLEGMGDALARHRDALHTHGRQSPAGTA